MDWRKLLEERRVERRKATREELDVLRAKIRAKLEHVKRAKQADFAADERFSLAYDAARLSAVLAIRAAGYRVLGTAVHYNTFRSLRAALGPAVEDTATYLDQCRNQRNLGEYTGVADVSDAEAEELAAEATELWAKVESWIGANHPSLAAERD